MSGYPNNLPKLTVLIDLAHDGGGTEKGVTVPLSAVGRTIS